MPILEVQRRAVEVGRIRAGEKGGRGEPRKLEKWRLTSKSEARLQAAAERYGGKVRPWKDRPGEFELYTETAELPIMLLPGQVPSTWYELWSKGGCQRRCDGQHELISDSSCICNTEEQARQCDPHTRLNVMLNELPGVGSWLLQSNGWNAAAELAGSADLLQRASAAGVLLPALLILQQRHEVKGGQTRRFAVPVIDIGVSMNELLASQGTQVLTAPPALEAAAPGGTPIERKALETGGVSVAQGLRAVEPRGEVAPRSNAAEPLGAPVAEAEVGASPEAPAESEAEPSATAAASPGAGAEAAGAGTPASSASDEETEAPASPPAATAGDGAAAAPASPPAAHPAPAPQPSGVDQKPVTQAQKKLLNTLYGELREVPMDGDGNVLGNPLVTVGGLYAWAARERHIEVDLMVQLLVGRDENG